MQRWIIVTALTVALGGLAVPAVADPDPDSDGPTTVVRIGDARIDPKIPGKVRVDVVYVCGVAAEARSLTVTVEQQDPEDAASKAFGSSRTAETDILCDGTEQHRQIAVQSKTSNWIPDVDAVLTATVANLGSAPPASADARRIRLVTA
ncbi:hypothetical protein PUR71_26640 [Streptomyces sp. SP17BM10]|uniref:hypothetical protein n=1 Tax=Streptomyces sp. SP17BM10 TaxID=3002530 RepID=UPI002E78D5CD|nr:hypothetical protein [Streptomyces sp. SP17BM10]MEE1786455.1 hypothetical protein [Streptomyces sp. SP17BM10]